MGVAPHKLFTLQFAPSDKQSIGCYPKDPEPMAPHLVGNKWLIATISPESGKRKSKSQHVRQTQKSQRFRIKSWFWEIFGSPIFFWDVLYTKPGIEVEHISLKRNPSNIATSGMHSGSWSCNPSEVLVIKAFLLFPQDWGWWRWNIQNVYPEDDDHHAYWPFAKSDDRSILPPPYL